MAFVFSLIGRRTDNEIWQANNKVETRILTHLELISLLLFRLLYFCIIMQLASCCYLMERHIVHAKAN
jgi:hypothetical protein